MNYRVTLQYDGTEFHGWQVQEGLRTVQGELARALALLEGGREEEVVVVHGAGRTDAGVHAEAQVASFHLRREISPERLRAAINGNTGRDLCVTGAAAVPADFHARFAATGKTYRYRVFHAPYLSPFWVRYAHHEPRPLDLGRMREAARLFPGRRDWTAFSSAQTEAVSRVRTVTRLEVEARPDLSSGGHLFEFTVTAEGFLRYMARSIIGTLLAVGRGEMEIHQAARAIERGERDLAGPTAPAHGLTLCRVHYGRDVDVPV